MKSWWFHILLTPTMKFHTQPQKELSTFLSLCVCVFTWRGKTEISLEFDGKDEGGRVKDSYSPWGSLAWLAVLTTYSTSLVALKHLGQLTMTRIQGLYVFHINLACFDKQKFLRPSWPHTFPCMKKETYLNLWNKPNHTICDAWCDQREVCQTMFLRFIANLLD